MTYELFHVHVTDHSSRTFALEKIGAGTKAGWCPADEFMADWKSFAQGPRNTGWSAETNTCTANVPRFAQTTGLGDTDEYDKLGIRPLQRR